MTTADMLLGEFTHEAANTRKVLERVPMDKKEWKPHEKSMSLGKLSGHLADLVNWTPMTIESDELDLAGGYGQPTLNTSEELLAYFDKGVEAAKKAIAGLKDEHLGDTWTLRSGDHVILAMSRAECLRSMCFNHTVHHRGQLTVYLRLLGIPVPGMYGPSADEQ